MKAKKPRHRALPSVRQPNDGWRGACACGWSSKTAWHDQAPADRSSASHVAKVGAA